MAEIYDFEDTATGNNTSGGALFPEQIRARQVNDGMREVQAAIRRQWNDSQWFVFGDGSGTPTFSFVSGNQFRVSGSLATQYAVGRRVRITGPSNGTKYGSITARSVAGGFTTVTMALDGGATLVSEAGFLVALGTLTAGSDSALPRAITADLSLTGSLTVSGDIVAANIANAIKAKLVAEDTTRYNRTGGGPLTLLSHTFTKQTAGDLHILVTFGYRIPTTATTLPAYFQLAIGATVKGRLLRPYQDSVGSALNFTSVTLQGKFSGLAAGSHTLLVQANTEAVGSMNIIVNPTTTDGATLPASTTATIAIEELA